MPSSEARAASAAIRERLDPWKMRSAQQRQRARVAVFEAEAEAASFIEQFERPRTRGDCLPGGCNEQRPCPWAGCAHHLYLDADPVTGQLKLNAPDLELDQMAETCSLDVAERDDGCTLEEVGEIMNLTRERIRQIEVSGLIKIKVGLRQLAEGIRIARPMRKLTPRRKRMVERVERVCVLCGKTFYGTRRQDYDSEACRIAGQKKRARIAMERWRAK